MTSHPLRPSCGNHTQRLAHSSPASSLSWRRRWGRGGAGFTPRCLLRVYLKLSNRLNSDPTAAEAAEPSVPPHLFAGLNGDVLGEDLLSLGGHLGLRLDLLVILARQPEFQILLAELGAQERSERRQPV